MRTLLGTTLLILAACKGPGTMQLTCPDGFTACNGECVNLQNDAEHCGSCDHACQSTEECVMAMCQPICGAGLHACNGVCVSDSDVAHCGKSCTPCPQPANSVATCDGTACGLICDPTQRACGGACATCPGSGAVMCSGTQCVASDCPAGQHRCNGQCVDEGPGSCGDTCLSCPAAPTNGFQVCLNGGCEYLCRAGYRTCAAGCCRADVMETGAFHSCQLTPTNTILCWGQNHLDGGSGGALGVGDYLDRAQPTAVVLASNVSAVQPGAFHTCSMDVSGAVSCWGVAGLGRIGDGSTSDKLVPTAVTGLGAGAAIALSAGGTGACALSRTGQLSCWGDNAHGELGDGSMSPHAVPTAVPLLGTSVVDVSFGGSHVCALLRGGVVRCWGDNTHGQLGDGSQTDRPQPVAVAGLSGVVRISAGDSHTCAILSNGDVMCWGDNAGGQLGQQAATAFSATPLKVDGVTEPTVISAGGAHTCALLATGQILCWGANDSGQLGDGTTMGRSSPAPVSGITDGTTVSAGRAHTCGRTMAGTRCWGNNALGQLGDGTTVNRPTPVMPH